MAFFNAEHLLNHKLDLSPEIKEIYKLMISNDNNKNLDTWLKKNGIDFEFDNKVM